MTGWIIAIVIVAGVGLAGASGIAKLQKEHKEAKNLPLNSINFNRLKDGTYIGEYEGGMYQWRTNRIQVIVTGGKVSDIKVLEHKENQSAEFLDKLFGRVINSQSLQVDAISGATLTSKAYLQGVENALKQAQY